jgi:hypothetical protein
MPGVRNGWTISHSMSDRWVWPPPPPYVSDGGSQQRRIFDGGSVSQQSMAADAAAVKDRRGYICGQGRCWTEAEAPY